MKTLRQTMIYGAILLLAPAVRAAMISDAFEQQSPTPVAAVAAPAATATADKVTVPFSDPSRPGVVKVTLVSGSIQVTAHQGKDVLVSSRLGVADRGGDSSERQGMRRLRNASGGLTIEEERNEMRIASSNPNHPAVLEIQVPTRTSLVLSTLNDGDIAVQGVDGDLEVNNTNGRVTLTNVSGTVVAHALNEDVTVSMTRVSDKPMSFTSLNGDINVTLPASVKATVRLESGNGEIYSDFDVDALQPVIKREGGERNSGGKYALKVDHAVTGRINGGGPELTFKTFNGDIRVKKN